MPTTYNSEKSKKWEIKQEKLIASLTKQPLIILIRISDLELTECKLNFSKNLISNLLKEGVKNLEIRWSSHPNWKILSKELLHNFKEVSFGAASIINNKGLLEVCEIGFSYAMSPFFDEDLIQHSREIGQLLVPGVLTPSEIQKAIKFNYKVLKLFPASIIGFNYLNQIKVPFHSLPFIIGAGGIKAKDIDKWLYSGFNAIALGRGLYIKNKIDPNLREWIKSR